jgi:hypothetical protein
MEFPGDGINGGQRVKVSDAIFVADFDELELLRLSISDWTNAPTRQWPQYRRRWKRRLALQQDFPTPYATHRSQEHISQYSHWFEHSTPLNQGYHSVTHFCRRHANAYEFSIPPTDKDELYGGWVDMPFMGEVKWERESALDEEDESNRRAENEMYELMEDSGWD